MYPPAIVPRDSERLRGLRVRHRAREESLPVDAGRTDCFSATSYINQKVRPTFRDKTVATKIVYLQERI